MKLHRNIVGDNNCHIQTILVESVKLGYLIHDLEVGEYQHFERPSAIFFEVFLSISSETREILKHP